MRSTNKFKKIFTNKYLLFLFTFAIMNAATSQTLALKDAVEKGVAQYGILIAKNKYALASKEKTIQIQREFLPNVNLSAQQDFGTINGQNGPIYGLGLSAASSGPALLRQNWNAAFGALYLININWEFYSFGRNQQRIHLSRIEAELFQKDYEQELFQHKIRISGAYLNLLASQRLLITQQKNLERAKVFHRNVAERVKNGLLPGVDSTLASAEVSRARITLNQIKDQVKIQNNELVQLMGIDPQDFITDTLFINHLPKTIANTVLMQDSADHPTRQYFKYRILQSNEQEKLYKKESLPSFVTFGVFQTRGSGFNSDYSTNQQSYSKNYVDGIKPTRQNYLLGVGAIWNLTSITRTEKKVSYQKLVSEGLEAEYKAIDTELKAREDAANARIGYAIQNYNEAPLQVNAAQQAYIQRLTLYNNGLADLTDVTTAQFTLNRAETDRDIAFTNVWQALLMKAAATGDFNLFINEF